MMNNHAPFLFAILVTLALGLPRPSKAQPLVHFENLNRFASVEGPGTVHPDLEIDALYGTAEVVEAGGSWANNPSNNSLAYSAPNDPDPSLAYFNNCLEDEDGMRVDIHTSQRTAKGFFDINARDGFVPQEIDFSFLGNVTVSDFSVVMLDFGDYNPFLQMSHGVTLRALDQNGGTVDEYVLDYNSDGLSNPLTSDYGNLLTASGDACTDESRALDPRVPNSDSENIDGPGYLQMKVTGAGITKVELRVRYEGLDPAIAFDSIHFVREAKIDIEPTLFPNAINAIPGQPGNTVTVAILGSQFDPLLHVPLLDVTQIDQSSIRFAGAAPAQTGGQGNPTPACSVQDVTGLYGTMPASPLIGIPDGADDLICTFMRQSLDMIGLAAGQGELSANLSNGTPISGTDSVTLVPGPNPPGPPIPPPVPNPINACARGVPWVLCWARTP